MNFDQLVSSIQQTSSQLKQHVVKAVNVHISLRNWLIGYYIVEFEQKGEDKAQYGAKLLPLLASELKSQDLKNVNERELRNFRKFYKTYICFAEHLSSLPIYSLISNKLEDLPIRRTLSAELVNDINSENNNTDISIRGTVSPELQNFDYQIDESIFVKMFTQIPYSHFVELFKIKDNTKRKFYELLIMKNTLSVRELERQIATLSYERLGLSKNTELAFKELESKINPSVPEDAIKSIYFFDFLNLPNSNLIQESELEQELTNHLEKFILELGNGFCFEARQKRLLIDEEYYFVDLVFYHRVLKCHILIDLKIDKFKHEHLSQLNSYVSCYKDQIKLKGDNDPIGILLCTDKGKKMVEYALAGMEEKLFVGKYLLDLPSKELLESFLENELKKM